MASSKVFLFFLFLSTFKFLSITCTEFAVDGKNGWKTPKSKSDQQVFNNWASKNRFIVGDSLYFKYEKDSVLVVTEEEYEKCHSSHPVFFSNNGETVFHFDRAGLFYFISGVSGHCERGQKMIIKVLEAASPPQPPANQNGTTDTSKSSALGMFASSIPASVLFMVLFIGVVFVV